MFAILLCLTLVLSCTQAEYYPWMYYLPYGNKVILKPLFQNQTEGSNVFVNSCKWITPSKIMITPQSNNFDEKRYILDESNCHLTITNIQKDTNGVYHCIINEFFISKAMLNVHGAPKTSPVEEYVPNLIAAFSTAIGFFQFMLKFLIHIIHTYSYLVI
jgi:hypothetical protein